MERSAREQKSPRGRATPVAPTPAEAPAQAGPAPLVALPAHGTAGRLRRAALLGRQRAVGNAGTLRSVARSSAQQGDEREPPGVCPVCGKRGRGRCPGCGQPFAPVRRAAVHRDDQPADPAVQAADAVYDALDGWDDEAKAIRSLTGHDQGTRERIKSEFQSRHKQQLQSYLIDNLSGEDLVRATALLHSSNTHEQHTSVALAVIPTGTRDEELLRTVEGLPLGGRKQLQEKYNQAFAPIGKGSLEKDLIDDLSGWRLQKTLALFQRDLTPADHLYFLSVAITGTHTDSVIKLIQERWNSGPAAIGQLDDEWKRDVKGSRLGGDVWTEQELFPAIRDELSGESLELVDAIFKSYEAFKRGDLSADEAELKAARDSLTAATTGGITGAGTNEEQVFAAVAKIRTIWRRRIDAAPTPEQKRQLEEQWEAERKTLLPLLDAEMDEGSADNQRSRLLLAGDLTLADEVYLAKAALDSDQVVSLVGKAWGLGKIGELLAQARQPKTDAAGATLRPSFDPLFLVPVTSGITWQRVHSLTRDDLDDAGRGAARLALELDEGDNDSDLKRAYELLAGAGGALQQATVARFAEQRLAAQTGSPAEKFLAYINGRYQRSFTCYQFADLLDPTTDPQKLADRAKGRLETSQSSLVAAYDAVTGEDSQAAARESYERLQFIAQKAGAKPEELQAMVAMSGAGGVEQLAVKEYDAFKARLDEVRALRQSLVDAVAAVVEVVAEAILTVATAGAAGGLLIASLGAAVAGMVARELLLGQDYDLLSKENAQQLALIVAGQGFGAMGGKAFSEVVSPERMQQLGKAGKFMEGAFVDGVSQLGTQTLASSFSGKMPTVEGVGASAVSILGSAAGAGAGKVIGTRANSINRLRITVAANVTQQMASAMADEGGSMVQGGVGDLTGPQIAGRFGARGAKALGSGVVAGVKDVVAEDVANARAERKQGQQEEGPQPDQAGGAPQVNPAVAHSDQPGIIAVVRVNDEHTISITRGDDGKIFIKMCSDCAALRKLLTEIKAAAGDKLTPQAEGEYHAKIAQIEAALNKKPDDPAALAEFAQLGKSLNGLLASVPGALSGKPPGAVMSVADLLANGKLNDAELQGHYATYAEGRKQAGEEPAPPDQWIKLTRGAARERLDALLGQGWSAQLSGSGGGGPSLKLADIARPADYADAQLSAHLARLQQSGKLFERLGHVQFGDEISQGHLNILKGNIGEILSEGVQQGQLAKLRQKHPDAAIHNGLTMQIMGPDGKLRQAKLFSDNVIAVERDGNLHILALFEVKAGSGGGQEATSQIHTWVEGHMTEGEGSRLVLPDGRSFRYDPGSAAPGQVVGLARAPRHIVATEDAKNLGKGSGDQSVGEPERHGLGLTSAQLEYLARRAVETRQGQ